MVLVLCWVMRNKIKRNRVASLVLSTEYLIKFKSSTEYLIKFKSSTEYLIKFN